MYHFKVPDKDDNETYVIESFYTRFQQRHHACPAFYMGSLSNACEAAFSSTVIKEVCSNLFSY